jgi:para-aminobenzoate synthetase / 4-amino-4-deoxychorismate lyase
MRWQPGAGFFLLPDHLQRLQRSAGYFGFPFNLDEIHQTLEKHAATSQKPDAARAPPPLSLR